MKQKYMRLAVVGLMVLTFMTGCGNQIPDLTEEQAKQVGEYAAITLLKYDANHRSRLVDASVIEAHDAKEKELEELAAQATPEPTPEGMKPVEDTPVIDDIGKDLVSEVSSLDDMYELPEGVAITYRGYQVCDSYIGEASGDSLALDAATGKKLLVLQFNIANQSENAQNVDLFSKTSTYGVTINGTYSEDALTTILMDDISTYINIMQSGESKAVVLLVEIEENMSGNISTVSLNLKNESKTSTIQLQ